MKSVLRKQCAIATRYKAVQEINDGKIHPLPNESSAKRKPGRTYRAAPGSAEYLMMEKIHRTLQKKEIRAALTSHSLPQINNGTIRCLRHVRKDLPEQTVQTHNSTWAHCVESMTDVICSEMGLTVI